MLRGLCERSLLSCFRFACPVEFLPREIPKGHFTGARCKRDYSTGVSHISLRSLPAPWNAVGVDIPLGRLCERSMDLGIMELRIEEFNSLIPESPNSSIPQCHLFIPGCTIGRPCLFSHLGIDTPTISLISSLSAQAAIEVR